MKYSVLIFMAAMCLISSKIAKAQWVKTNGPYGGYVNSLAKVQGNIWAGVRSGVYSSSNEGITWTKLGLLENKNVLGIYSDGDTVILMYNSWNVEGNYTVGTQGQSITSFDGGASWTFPVPVALDNAPMPISRIQNTLLINSKTSSLDFGLSWANIQGPWGDSFISYVSSNDSISVICALNYFSHYYSRYISTDGLQSWQLLDSSINYRPNGLVTKSNTILSQDDGRIIRSADFGATYDTVLSTNETYMSTKFLERNNVLYLTTYINNVPYYYQSNDDGITWLGVSSYPKEMAQPIALQNNDTLFIDNNYYSGTFIARSLSGTDTSIQSNTGISSNTIYHIASNNNILFASKYYNLTYSIDGGLTWSEPTKKLRSVFDMEFFGDTIFAAGQDSIFRSYNNGLNWEGVTGGFVMDESTLAKNGDTLFAGRAGMDVVYTTDFGNTWYSMPALSTTLTNVDGGNITVLNNTLYAVTNGGYIFKYNSINNAWTQLHEFWSPGAHNNNKLYTLDTVLAMTGRDEFLISHDHGNTWVESPLTGLPFGVVYPRNITPYNGIWLASCGTYGIYKSIDEGISWQSLDAVPPPFVALNGFAVVNDILYAGTAWNSVWRRAAPFSSISGQVYLDVNNNGIKDTAEQPVRNALVYTRIMGHTATTDTAGNYTLVTDAIGDTMRVALPNPYFTSTPQYYITTGTDTAKDFGLYVPPSIVDISVELTNTSVFRPGFNTNILLEVRNNSMSVQSPTVMVVLDSALQYTGASMNPTNTVNDTLIWHLSPMVFAESRQITVSITTIFSAELYSAVTSFAMFTPTLGDTFPENNISILTDTIVGSYDPNDKQCSMGNKIMPQQIQEEEEVVFTVRFQNTGNYQADFVRIADTISSFFDLSTFKVLSSSHTMHWSMQGQGIVNFYFDSILLPSMADDEPGSHGFVKYSVKCKQSNQIGDAITNTAYIYFDFNAPIITTTTTTIVTLPFTTTNIQDEVFVKDLDIKVYPNPSSNKLNIDLSALGNSTKQIAIYSIEGIMMISLITNELLSTVSTDKLPSGIYFGVINSGSTVGKFKFITAR